MRVVALALTGLLAGCSRADANALRQRHKTPDPHLRALAPDKPVSPEAHEPSHVFALPSGFGFDMAPGTEPSPDHPSGTIYLLGTLSVLRT